MMGSTHVTMAMIGGTLTLPLAGAAGVSSPHEQAAWIIIWGGAGLAPDFDHPNAHAAHMWGPLSQAMAAAVATLAGGHRKGTHDLLLAPAGFALLCTIALAATNTWTAIAVLALTIGLSLRGLQSIDLGRTAEGTNLALSFGGAWWIVHTGRLEQLALLPVAFAGGVLCHLIGDGLTDEKLPIPILWLFGHERRIGLPLMATGKTFELFIWMPAMTALLLWLLADVTDIHSFTDLRLAFTDVIRASLDAAPAAIRELWRVAELLR